MEQHLIDIAKFMGEIEKVVTFNSVLNAFILIGIFTIAYKLGQIGTRIDELTGRRKKKEKSDDVKAFGVEKS